MKKRYDIWVFNDNCVIPDIRLLGPFGTFPKDEVNIICAPSMRAILKLSRIPDAIVFHRDSYPFSEIGKIMSFARSNRIPTIFDIDDLLIEVPLHHPSYARYEAAKPAMMELLKTVDAVIVATDKLGETYRIYNPNIYTLPNLMDECLWKRENKISDNGNDRISIGYAGTATHDRDLAIVTPAIRNIMEKYKGRVSFTFIGSMPKELEGSPEINFVKPISPYAAYARFMKSCGFDIALAVLEDSRFNQCKSNIKFMEYSICGYPGIYSRVDPYINSVIDNNTGILVNNTTEEWVRAMELLIENSIMRKAISDNAYKDVVDNYSLQRMGKEWHRVYGKIIAAGKTEGRRRFSPVPFISYGPFIVYALLKKIYHSLLSVQPG